MGDVGMGGMFRRWDTASGSWEKLTEINSITPAISMSREVHPVGSDLDRSYETYKGGKRNPGIVTVNANFNRDVYDKLLSDFESDDTQNYEIVLNDADNTSRDFEGLITELSVDVPAAKMTMTWTIQISGEPTIESGSGPSPG